MTVEATPPEGYYGNLNAKQQEAFDQLREELPNQPWYNNDPRFTALFLLRFCRARNFVVADVLEMLRKDAEWRSKPLFPNRDNISVGEMLAAPRTPEVDKKIKHIKKHYSTGYHGVDKFGRPIYIDRFGQLDMPGLLREAAETDVIEHFVRETEAVQTFFLPCSTLHARRVVETTMNIMDLKGLSFASATNSVVRKVSSQLVQIPQDHYPETMGALYVVNAPRVFSFAWSAIKPMLNERTQSKIKFVNSITERDNALLADVDATDLPKWLGGTCECPGGCLSKPKGPWCDPAILKKLERQNYYDIQSEHFTPIEDEAETASSSSAGPSETSPVRPVSLTTVSEPSSPIAVPPSPTTPRPVFGPLDAKDIPSRLPSYYSKVPIEQAKIRGKEDYEALLAELAEQEERHMNTLQLWSKIQLEYTIQLTPYVINRAAKYYDAFLHQKKCANAVTECTQIFHDAGKQFESASQRLRECEILFEKITDPDERNKLVWRICQIADEVAKWQSTRDETNIRCSTATHHLSIAQSRWNQCRTEHDYCTYNCSVIKAKPYYTTYAEHEELVSIQMKQIESMEQRVAEAKQVYNFIRRQAELSEDSVTRVDHDDVVSDGHASKEPVLLDQMVKLHQLELRPDDDSWESCHSDDEDT
eukprot:GEMP01007821.1.p1 GENE.GEMP01007821.1~~GEMP01007821.1.p1  ORF type:complete len:646 (+),score=127.25 GEMP01007821.1:140-2077(+)